MSVTRPKRTRRQARAVLVAHGASAPANKPRYASYGAGVVTPGTPVLGVSVVSEGGGKVDQHAISLTRFAPGTRIPGYYRVITEGAAED